MKNSRVKKRVVLKVTFLDHRMYCLVFGWTIPSPVQQHFSYSSCLTYCAIGKINLYALKKSAAPLHQHIMTDNIGLVPPKVQQ